MQSTFAEKSFKNVSRAIANQTMAVQSKKMPAVPALQKKAAGEEELPLQGKFTVQMAGDKEEAVQMKVNPVQKMGPHEEEEPVQGRFVVQKVGGPEEELPAQGMFNTIQKAALEEEKPVQGKFNTVQLVGGPEEEMPAQGKFVIQRKENKTGMPDNLKSGVENLSGMDMSDVRVHYNSSQPAQLNALAYAQGTNIHVAPGQEKHLPHEAWHVVQQKQGRVQPTLQMKAGVPVNDDKGLENEADVMGAKALQMQLAANNTAIQKKSQISR